jgi:hypothetical protein
VTNVHFGKSRLNGLVAKTSCVHQYINEMELTKIPRYLAAHENAPTAPDLIFAPSKVTPCKPSFLV